MDGADAEHVVLAMRTKRYQVIATVEHEATGRLATVRLVRDQSGVVTDLLFVSSGIEREVVDAAETLEILRGLHLPVARTGHLIAMKLLAQYDRQRPNDADDLRALSLVASA